MEGTDPSITVEVVQSILDSPRTDAEAVVEIHRAVSESVAAGKPHEGENVLAENELYVLTGKEIMDVILEAHHLGQANAIERANQLAVNIKELDDYGYCGGCGGERYRR